MKIPKLLHGFMTVLGIVFLTIFFPNPHFSPALNLFFFFWSNIGSTSMLLISCFFSIVGVVFLTGGICRIISQYYKKSQKLSTLQPKLEKSIIKYSKLLFRLTAVLGIVFLTIFFTGYYSFTFGLKNVFESLPYTPIGFYSTIFCLFGGIAFLTVGTCGIVRQYFKNNQSFFTILFAILIPSLILIPFLYSWMNLITILTSTI
ncbi:MAG: hypothetical protein P8X91_00120 [Candidatus Bathyarchaeota archaeon]